MTLGTGDHVAKLKRIYNPETKTQEIIRELVENEAYHEFEVVNLDGCKQDDPEGFRPLLKLVK